ncbi:hypothetical protein C4D60_Mb00t14590 [Musa balbisiana]|uniref:Uncharacterized protein n=1 Tax=Musa balbisiana TaxID=52838 RepID=A0A4S8I639_MUSBA|nr:hypothetical protein C4D60_Mb00t14590 [Musa balbisiana]
MLIPQIPSLFLLREKKFTTRGPSTSTRPCSVRLSPIAENSPTAASRKESGPRKPLLGRIPPLLLSLRGISNRFQLLFPSQGQVLTRYSPVRHWKHHFPSDLHVLSMPPAFILSQDRTLHEIHSCITYSFLVRRQS